MSIQVAIVEDNESVRENLAAIIESTPGFRCAAAYADAEEALLQFSAGAAEVVLMDINLPGKSGVDCVRELKTRFPSVHIIMLTIEEDSRRVFESLQAGASGYLVKHLPPARILEAIREVHAGGAPMSSQIARLVVQSFQKPPAPDDGVRALTPREEEILDQLSKGYRSKEIGDALGISTLTVNTHIRNIYEKLHVRSRAEAVARFLHPS